ncbi:hypothetical protein BC835DRAFT_1440559 [Cytidiella melzeri]|nr:hypothetical protein BC835DRAFT_1440559 [Cytidiella melzeri]
MDPFDILRNQLPAGVADALEQIIASLTTRLQEAQQQALDAQHQVQAAQQQLLTQQQFEQSITTALSQAQLTVQAPAAAAPTTSRGSLRVSPQRFSVPPFSQTSVAPTPSADRHSEPAPMDLDAMQQSANVRCYNCNERGHVARDCRRTRTGAPSTVTSSNAVRTTTRRPYGAPRPQQMHAHEVDNSTDSQEGGHTLPELTPAPYETVNPSDVMLGPTSCDDDENIPGLNYLNSEADDEASNGDQEETLTDDDDLYLNFVEITDEDLNGFDDGFTSWEDDFTMNVHEDAPTNPTYPVRLGPSARDLHGVRANTAQALLDTGATSNYVTRRVAQAAGADFFSITPREVVGAGKTTTVAFARMTLILDGRVRENFLAYILEPTSGCH